MQPQPYAVWSAPPEYRQPCYVHSIAILILTGDGSAEAKEKALWHGAHDFLHKPLNRAEVQLRVRNLLETRHLHLQLKAQNESQTSLLDQVRDAILSYVKSPL